MMPGLCGYFRFNTEEVEEVWEQIFKGKATSPHTVAAWPRCSQR